jgi:hypothetical protein
VRDRVAKASPAGRFVVQKVPVRLIRKRVGERHSWYSGMSARQQSASAVSWGSGEVADHGVAFRPEANVGQVVASILHSGWCDHSSTSARRNRGRPALIRHLRRRSQIHPALNGSSQGFPGRQLRKHAMAVQNASDGRHLRAVDVRGQSDGT